jgi:hypothetical protein
LFWQLPIDMNYRFIPWFEDVPVSCGACRPS